MPFLDQLGKFFWSRTLHRIIVSIVVLAVVLYTEEDWRGAHNWAVTKAKWEAQGESFDRSKFVPPPVPDDQNIAALPLFQLEKIKEGDSPGYLSQVKLRHAMRDDLPSLENVPAGNWTQGELPDMAAIRKAMAGNYALANKNAKPPDDLLAQLNGIYPFLPDFLAAAATRSSFRVNYDYLISPPVARPLGPLTDPIKLAKILSLQAVLSLDHHQPDIALQDIKINLTVAQGAGRDPTLVGGLVALGVAAIGHGAIYDGLAQHAWNDTQLAELEQALKPVDFLATYQFSMRGEVAQTIGTLEFFQHMSRSDLERVFGRVIFDDPLTVLSRLPWPDGWWDQNKSRITDSDFRLLAAVDPQAHLCAPKLAAELQDEAVKAQAQWDADAPWKILAVMMAGPMTGAPEKFAEGQALIDEMRIACALERYRLAHNAYPASLDALAPALIDVVPHDPMSGKPYRYFVRADGTFALYSVGWNQVDDGGAIVTKKENPKLIDYDNGDWVWPTPKKGPSSLSVVPASSKTDFLTRRLWRRREKRLDSLINITQRGIMGHQGFFDVGQALSHDQIRG